MLRESAGEPDEPILDPAEEFGQGEGDRIEIRYEAEPTVSRFHHSGAEVRGIMGPMGSGKTSGCIMELLRLGKTQAKSKDGYRYTRTGVIRNTYPELVSTTLESFKEWFPPEIMTVRMSSPIQVRIQFEDVRWSVWFVSIDRPDDVKKLLSMQLTNAWLNEARELTKAALDMVLLRIGRYPRKEPGFPGASRPCVLLDTNPPDVDHWYYQVAEVERPIGWEFFKQPGALIPVGDKWLPNPKAENIRNLTDGFGYYFRGAKGKSRSWILVNLCGEYGTVLEGRPCYSSYLDSRHCSNTPLEVMRGLPLRLGWDFGLSPACIMVQSSPMGQLRVLREIVVDTDGPGMGIRRFAVDHVKPYLQTNFAGMQIRSFGDPAGKAKNDENTSALSILAEVGIETFGASSNDITTRLDDVDWFLTRNVDGDTPAFLLDGTNCPILRRGFQGGYQMKRVQVQGMGAGMYQDTPVKNKYSHPHDGLQYIASDCRTVRVVGPTSARGTAPVRRWTI